MKDKASAADIVFWIVLAALWSSSYTAIKVGVHSLFPVVLVAGRLLIGAMVLYAVLKMSRMNLSWRLDDWKHYAVSGLMGSAIPFLLISYGEQTVDSALASILMGIAPVTTVFMASVVFADESLTRRIVLGLVCGVAGIILLVGPGALTELGGDLPAQLSILAAALCYGVTTIYVRRFVKRPPLEMATGSTIVAAGAMVFLMAVSGRAHVGNRADCRISWSCCLSRPVFNRVGDADLFPARAAPWRHAHVAGKFRGPGWRRTDRCDGSVRNDQAPSVRGPWCYPRRHLSGDKKTPAS